MIRVSKLTDYGMLVATHLAGLVAGQRRSAGEIAAETGVPVPTVSKVLKALARADVLHATRGSQGGYALAREPEEISMAAVIEALEGPIAVTECLTDDSADSCACLSTCTVQGNWRRINLVLRDALAAVSLRDMALPARRDARFDGRSEGDARCSSHAEKVGVEPGGLGCEKAAVVGPTRKEMAPRLVALRRTGVAAEGSGRAAMAKRAKHS